MVRLIAATVLSILLLLPHAALLAAAEVEAQIPFKFTATGLTPGKSYAFTFRLYEASTGGEPVWYETKSYAVPANLVLTHQLGKVRLFALGAGGDSPVPVDFSRQLWVEVRVGAKVIGKGRVKLSAVPYALWSAETGALPRGDECGIGEVLFRAPAGWECGAIRPFVNGIGICVGADCLLSCALGWDNCDLLPANGCETALASDANNCSSCGNACPSALNASPACTAGNCGFTCNTGYSNCDGGAENGCEVNLTNSTDNCGGCGNLCPSPFNATGYCSGGMCQLACTSPWANCDLNPVNGCEADLSTSVDHCGSCLTLCPTGANASRTCLAGVCSFTCNAGYGNCNNNAADGCEVSLASNALNCGRCGNVCPARANASSTCVASQCSFTCATGYGNCDGNATNGCEVTLASDIKNCGMCGRVCGVGQSCVSGACY